LKNRSGSGFLNPATTTTCIAHTRSGPVRWIHPSRTLVRRAVVSKSISKFKWLALDTSKKDTLITLHARITISIMQFTSITRCAQITHCSCRQVFAEPQRLQQERSPAYRPGLRKVRCRSRPPTSISLYSPAFTLRVRHRRRTWTGNLNQTSHVRRDD
jgi:hypothetical protein